MAQRNPARGRKTEGTQGAVAFFSAGHTRKFTGCTWYKIEFGKEEGNLEALSKKGEFHERNPCAPSFENNHQRSVTTSRLYQQSSVEFGRENMQAQNQGQLRFILL